MTDGGFEQAQSQTRAQTTEKPRLLVIERHPRPHPLESLQLLEERFELIRARSMMQAMSLLREQNIAGVFVEMSQLPVARQTAAAMQADEILGAIADGVAVVDPEMRITWCNPGFRQFAAANREIIGVPFAEVLAPHEILAGDTASFWSAPQSRTRTSVKLRVAADRYLRLDATPVMDDGDRVVSLIALARDITAEVLREQKISAIHKAGEELDDIRPEELAEMSVEDRDELLKQKILSHMNELLRLDYFEIRLLDQATGRLNPLLAAGMTREAMGRELLARKEGHGVTGYVAATGESYLCRDTMHDPIYLEGIEGARSSLTVPLIHHGAVIGTLNVESNQPDAFDDSDRQFLEIYARNLASALRTLDLLLAEKTNVASQSIETIRRALALPIDQILNDASTALDRYAGHDEEIVHRLRHVIHHARDIRGLIEKTGSSLVPDAARSAANAAPKPFEGLTILVIDPEVEVRRKVHQILGENGAVVETASDALEAIALARQTTYSLAFVDIRLSDLPGFETVCKLREIQPDLPVILITSFGYDPTHAIPKCRPLNVKHALYKPFRPERLLEIVKLGLLDQ